jgi:hypothetical protein
MWNKLNYYGAVVSRKLQWVVFGNAEFRFLFRILLAIVILAIIFAIVRNLSY